MGKRITLVLRPELDAQQTEWVREGVRELREAGHDVEPRQAARPGDGRRFAAEAEVVAAVGGDGTLNEVVNGLGPARPRPALGVVPAGTANDFATGMGVPADLLSALRLLGSGRERPIDLARVNERYFVNVSTGGFGAEATESAPSDTKRLLGSWAYVVTGVRQFVELRPVRGRFEGDGAELYDGDFLLFAVGNGRQTGGGSVLTPRAEPDDGELDLLVVRAVPRVDFLSLMPDLRSGTHLESPDILYARVRELTLRTGETLSVNADGEPIRGREFRYRLDGTPIDLLVP